MRIVWQGEGTTVGDIREPPLEEHVAELFAEVLGIPDDFDRDMTFIQLGGQSVSAAQLQVRLMESLGARVSFAELCRNGTVGLLAALVEDKRSAQTDESAPEESEAR